MQKFDYRQLKLLREGRHITQKEMSELLNMTQSNYSKLENGMKKIDSLQTLENIATALEMPKGRLIGIMTHQENISSAGMDVSELLFVEKMLREKPLREDEFVFFSAEVLDIEKYDFKEYYSGLNLKETTDTDPFPIWDYPPEMYLMCSPSVNIGFDYHRKKLKEVSIWLGDKKLGIIPPHYINLVDELISRLLISRVVLIGNEESIAGYFDSYMKVVFIATNAVNKAATFDKGRFSCINFLNHQEVEEMDSLLFSDSE